MKLLISSTLLFALACSNAFAYAERACPQEKLHCQLDKLLSSGGRVTLAASVTAYDGTNSDEPSIEPDSCLIRTTLVDDKGITFNVLVDEVNESVDVYLMSRENNGAVMAGDTSFANTANKPFYYRYNGSLLTCTLK